MDANPENELERFDPEPRWQAFIAVVALGGLNLALPSSLIIGPRWLYSAVVIILLLPTIFTHIRQSHRINVILGFAVNGVVTLAIIVSIVLLIGTLSEQRETPTQLLTSAASLWLTNVLVFALWYWKLDAGGPHGREQNGGYQEGAFLFPQMTITPEANQKVWSPNFVDYLFLSFNTSAAFSPTDAPVLSRWAKFLMMTQSVISLTVIAVLATRAINTLPSN